MNYVKHFCSSVQKQRKGDKKKKVKKTYPKNKNKPT